MNLTFHSFRNLYTEIAVSVSEFSLLLYVTTSICPSFISLMNLWYCPLRAFSWARYCKLGSIKNLILWALRCLSSKVLNNWNLISSLIWIKPNDVVVVHHNSLRMLTIFFCFYTVRTLLLFNTLWFTKIDTTTYYKTPFI